MRTYNYITLSLLLALTACEGCKEDAPKPKTELEKLPLATQEGKNTFGCLVNGKAWVAPTSTDAIAVYQLGFIQISGKRNKPFQQISMSIYEKNNGELGTMSYPLNKFPDSFADASFQKDDLTSCEYESKNSLSGTVSLSKIDRTNYVVSGTFNFITISKGCDTLKITNGRFDIRYIP